MKNLMVFLIIFMMVGCSSKPPLPPEPKGPKTPINTAGGHRV